MNYLFLVGARMDVCDDHRSTPLHIAATNGLDGIVSDLVLKGADKDARDIRGDSPLMLAAQHGHLSAAKTLLASGADVNFRRTEYTDHSALDCAVAKGHASVLQAILDHGADVNSSGDGDGDGNGDTALHVAAAYDQAGAVHALIDAGADIESENSLGWTPLILASSWTWPNTMLAFLQRGANVNARNTHDMTPLCWACFQRRPGVQAAVDLLLRWGADETAVEALDERSTKASEREIANVRLLLARAPADRAWRRRGWLVMLRSRAVKARASDHAADRPSDSNHGGGSNGTGDRESVGRKMARTENGRGASQSASEQARRGDGGGEEGVLDLSGVVTLLLGLEPEGIFRTMVGFL